jgi:hypothetical protein
MLYLSHKFSSLSMPIVAPKMPLETSVGFAGAPVFVFALNECDQLLSPTTASRQDVPSRNRVHVNPISDENSFRHCYSIILAVVVCGEVWQGRMGEWVRRAMREGRTK